MKKFLSLVLALVMTMSLVTISAGAKEFADDDTITYDEAINVISTIGVVDGYEDGSFKPTTVLTRGAAAKIICNLILGPTTASELHADTAPFKDVPITNNFAGYIAYCAKEEIISGYADGTFRPGNTLTGYAFMKMLLGALGYDQDIEGYIGANWSIPVAKRALEVGLNKGLVSEFNGVKAVTREEACLYAFNALKADLVEYETSLSVNNAGNLTGLAIAKARTFQNSATKIEYIKKDNIIQFAEQYFPKLQLKDDTDVFGRPANTWVFDKREIGTYVDYTTLVAEYTEKVTGKTLYEEISKSVLDDSTVLVYVDGETESSVLGKAYFTRNQIAKTYDEKVGQTGNGVLTQVFVDTDADEVTIVVINTYLAQAEEDYDEKNDEVDLTVYSVKNVNSSTKTPVFVKDTGEEEVITVDGEDFAIEEVKEDDLFLVTVADGEIQSMEKPEIIADATITNFKYEKYVTAEGTKYDYADTVQYDEEVLDDYDDKNMKEVTYNVILDPYGYMIGIELVEEPDQYLFLTGIDLGKSNLSKKNADANVIFLDGTMETVTVNMDDSEMTVATKDASGKVNGTATSRLSNLITVRGGGAQLNTWCTYSVDKNGVYTLEQVAPTTIEKDKVAGIDAVKVAQTAQNVTGTAEVTIDKKNVSLDGAKSIDPAYDFTKVYGNDDTVYLNVEEDDLESIDDKFDQPVRIIDDVSSVTTGVKNVKLAVKNIDDDGTYVAPADEIYTLYKDNGYVIAAVVIGEDDGISSNYAYVTSDKVEQEAYDKTEDEYTWIREVVINGEVVELKEVGDHLKYLRGMQQGKWYEVKYDANGNVRNVSDAGTGLGGLNAINFTASNVDKFAATVNNLSTTVVPGTTVLEDSDTVVLSDTTTATKLTYKSGTLYTDTAQTEGFSVSPNVKVVLCLADEDGARGQFDDVDDSYTGYAGLEKALRNLNAVDPFAAGTVEVNAILESGVATSIILNDKAPARNDVDDAATPIVAVNDVTVEEGKTATFVAAVTANPIRDYGRLTYQWYKNGTKIVGATSDTLVVENVALADTGDTYKCEVTNTDTSKDITGKTEGKGDGSGTLTVTAKAPETMDIIVTYKDGTATVGSELLTGLTATGSVVTVDPSTLTAPAGYKVTDTVTKYVPFAANTAGSVEIAVAALSSDKDITAAATITGTGTLNGAPTVSGQTVTVATNGDAVNGDTITVALTAVAPATIDQNTVVLTYDGTTWTPDVTATVTAEDGTTATVTITVA